MSNQLPPDMVIAVRRLSQALSDPAQLMVRAGDSFESALIKLAADRIKESNNLTLQQITHVFEVWENEYRDDPSSFLTPDECAALEVATLSEQRAIHFTAILRNLGYQTALIRDVVREVIAEPVQQIVSQVSQTREQWLAVREGHFNAAAEEYFSARPHLDTPDIRRIFYDGHCKGYDAAPEAPVQDDQADPTRANAIYHQAFNSEGKAVQWGVRSSSDPSRDMRVMESAIEFFYAVQRGVKITPEMLWKQVMGNEWVTPPQVAQLPQITDAMINAANRYCRSTERCGDDWKPSKCESCRRDTAADLKAAFDAAQAPAQDDFKVWYEEAMSASNEAGFVGVSAAETIRELARQLAAVQEAPAQTEARVPKDREALARAMADKLMVWKLPENFGPDCFITFDRESAAGNPHCWPVGTNLFTHEQAVQMLLDIMPAAPLPAVVQVPQGWELVPDRLNQNMANAAKAVDGRLSVWKYDDAYRAMLAASPEAPAQEKSNG